MKKCPNCPHHMNRHDGDGVHFPFECLAIGCECWYMEDFDE